MIDDFDWQQLVWLDYFLLTSLVAVLVVGVYKGLVKEAVSFIFWPLAVWLAFNYYEVLSEVDFINSIDLLRLRYIIAFGLIFVATLLIGKLTAKIVTALLGTAGLSIFNRLLGGVFALMKGMFMMVVFFILLEKMPALEDVASTFKQGHLYQFIDDSAQWLKPKLALTAEADISDITTESIEEITE